MNEILNKMLLLLFSFLPLLFYPANVWFVGAFFVALSLSALCYILENKRLTFVSSLIYGLIGFAVPEFSSSRRFFPMISTDTGCIRLEFYTRQAYSLRFFHWIPALCFCCLQALCLAVFSATYREPMKI